MRIAKLIVVVCIAVAAPLAAFGQWVPVSATKTTRRVETGPSGKIIQDATFTGHYYRSDSGSVANVTVQSNPDGSFRSKSEKLLDNSGLAMYTIDYSDKIAYRTAVFQEPREFQDDSSVYAAHELGQATMDGLKCVILPMLENGKLIGKVWESPKYDLALKMDFTVDNFGYKTHVTTQLSNIHLNAKIPVSQFQLPLNFTVMDALPRNQQQHPGVQSMFP